MIKITNQYGYITFDFEKGIEAKGVGWISYSSWLDKFLEKDTVNIITRHVEDWPVTTERLTEKEAICIHRELKARWLDNMRKMSPYHREYIPEIDDEKFYANYDWGKKKEEE